MSEGLISFIFGIVLGMLVLAIIIPKHKFEKEIVSHGCAQYNSKTSDFEWIDTITKEPTP